jgi:Family of unknown function (DUF5681)
MSDNGRYKIRQRPGPRPAQPVVATDHVPAEPVVSGKVDQSGGERTYDVGRGKPPKHTRFKPGQSGNPRGRPKGSRNTATILQEKLDAKVEVREGGKIKRMSKREIGILKAVNKFAETGNIATMLAFARTLGESAEAKASAVAASSSQPDLNLNDAMLKEFLSGVLSRGGHVFDAPHEARPTDDKTDDEENGGRQ